MRLSILASILLLASTAGAQTGAPPPPPPMPAPAAQPPEPEEPAHRASITFSPVHLVFPIVEVTGEFAINDKIGVAAILGYGTVSAKTINETYRFKAWEAGAHFNYYALGTFDHGMQIGAEALYVHVSTDNKDVDISGAASGLAIGPYIGYKLITRVGFTFEANGGVQYVTMQADATDGTTSASKSKRNFIPLLNLNIGWSF